MTWEIREGDALAVLRTMESDSVDCVVTSPPYWGLRDYGVDGQMGLEPTPEAFLEAMVAVFREVRRVLKPTGTCWVNMGDSYAGSRRGGNNETITGKGRDESKKAREKMTASRRRDNAQVPRSDLRVPGLKPKDLVGMPWRLALALQADGWWLRRDIIWHKPNPMPESAPDRPTTAHEYLFLLTKAASYYYDADAIREDAVYGRKITPNAKAMAGRSAKSTAMWRNAGDADTAVERGHDQSGATFDPSAGRNKRSVWTIATQPFPESHFATFPMKMVEPCILAGSPGGGASYGPLRGQRHHGMRGAAAWPGLRWDRAEPRVRRHGAAPHCQVRPHGWSALQSAG